MTKVLDLLIDQIKNVDIDSIKTWTEGQEVISEIVEHQKVYIWIRLYLKEEIDNITIGDDISINYIPSGEKLVSKFVCFGKVNLIKDCYDEITNFNPENDKKCLCLMVDQDIINKSTDIPFIRTLFKTGIHYEYQLAKRDELLFINDRTGTMIDYYDCDY